MQRIKNFLSSLFSASQSGTENTSRPKTAHPTPDYRDFPLPRLRPVLSKTAILPDAEAKVYGLTEVPIWDWASFRGVLICLATLGVGRYIPARRRPDGVYLDGLYPTFADLRLLSGQRQGRETSRVVFVDRDRSCLVDSGITNVGSFQNGIIRMESEPGRGMLQVPVLSIHVHPKSPAAGGLSDRDYVTFLSDPRQIIMMICHSGGVVFAMKTSATRSEIGSETAQHMVSLIRKDIFTIWNNFALPDSILALNKAVCMEFGMTLYQAVQPYENIARRIEVANI